MVDDPRFVFEYEVTPQDVRDWRWNRLRNTWVAVGLAIRIIVSITLVGFAISHFAQGETIPAIALLVIAIFLHHPLVNIASAIFSRAHIQVRVYVTDVGIVSQSMGNTTRGRWQYLAKTHTADELPTYFSIHGLFENIVIPKRAFESEEQMHAFREFVRSKMGERCQFGKLTLK